MLTEVTPVIAGDMIDDLKLRTRLALRGMAKSVTVITCSHEGQRFAMAATAVDVISLDPPSMFISVNQASSMHRPLSAGVCFAINILTRSQEAVAQACGGGKRGEDRFTVGDWSETSNGVPFLEAAQAAIICKHECSRVFGTHRLVFGSVVEVRSSVGDFDPLVYVDGRYSGVQL